jgi:AmiR/NasT family two-component response regulator
MIDALRIQQNFRGTRALILADPMAGIEALATTLQRLGAAVERLPSEAGLPTPIAETLNSERDVLFIDGDLAGPIEIPLSPIGRLPPVPVIGLVGVEAPGRLKALLQIGATAFLRKPVYGSAVYSALMLGVNTFLHRRQLEGRMESQERRRRGRRFVIKAVIAVMRNSAMDDEAAYDMLRRESMKSRVCLEDYCEALVRSIPAADDGLHRLQQATSATN